MRTIFFVVCYSIMLLSGVYAQNLFETYYINRLHINSLAKDHEWIIRYSVLDDGEIQGLGFNANNGNFLRFNGRLTSPDQKNILLIDSYAKLNVTYSNQLGVIFSSNPLNGISSEVHMTHESYHGMLRQFELYHLEVILEDSPNKYLKVNGIPEILEAAAQFEPDVSELSQKIKNRYAPVFGFSFSMLEKHLDIGFVGNFTQADFVGLKKGDQILDVTANFSQIKLSEFKDRIHDEEIKVFHLWRQRINVDGAKSLDVLRLFRSTELERRLFNPPKKNP